MNSTKASPQNTSRKIAVIVGMLYILGTVMGVMSVIFTGPILDSPNYLLKVSENQSQLVIAALMVLTIAFGVGASMTAWSVFRARIKRADALLFATPEYNRSVPGALKNAIDVGSRPAGQSVWAGKPGAVVSVAPRSLGGFGANHHLRQCMVFLDVPMLQQPEMYIGGAAELFDAEGNVLNDGTREFLEKSLAAFARWIDTIRNARLSS